VEAASASGATVSYPVATASDTVSQVTLTYSQASGTLFPLGTTAVTVTATDAAGNSNACSFTVAVGDTTAPILSCGADVVAEATGPEGATVAFTLPTATDEVTPSPSLVLSHPPGTHFSFGTTVVSVRATDAAGNTRSCSFTVTVRDTTPPLVGCPADMPVEATTASGATVIFSSPAPIDAVTRAPIVSISHSPGSRFPLGTTPVRITATDSAGNTSACTFAITVRDTTAPTLTCPENVTAKASGPEGKAVTYPTATASDAVSTPVLRYSRASGEVFPLGTTPVTVTATDSAGNASTCSFQVTVQPQPPSEEPPSSGCGCGADPSAAAGLSWGGLCLLLWALSRRRTGAPA
jgi:hypothetical protein